MESRIIGRCTVVRTLAASFVAVAFSAASVSAQQRPEVAVPDHPPPPGERGSQNVHVTTHVPLGAPETVADVELEQELDRPFAYVARQEQAAGFDIIDLEDPDNGEVLYRWRIPNPELHQGSAMDCKYFWLDGRYYFVQSFQFGQGGPDSELAAIVFDVTSLPDTAGIEEAARIELPEQPGGFHNIFMYKHSDGRALLFATKAEVAQVYDMGTLLETNDSDAAHVTNVPIPPNPRNTGYHDFYVGYHPASGEDRFYGAGGEGFYVYDVTDLEEPELRARVTDVPGLIWGHTATPSPDGRYLVGETEYQYQPLRIFDLKPGLDGEVESVSDPIGAWHANWKTLAHNHEVRWPLVFVSGYETGMVVFNMIDPTDPYTVGYYDTFNGPHEGGEVARPNSQYTWPIYQGAWGVDVRNADGLIVASDKVTGFWAFRMEGFDGWNGKRWGMPNISSVQDWKDGPVGHGLGSGRSR